MRRRRGADTLARGALLSALLGGAATASAQDLPLTVTPSTSNPGQVVVSTTAGGGATAVIERRNLSSSIAWRTYHKMGWEALRAGKNDLAQTLFEAGSKEAQRIGANDRRLAASYNDLGWVFYQKGRPDDAEPLVRWALNTRIALLGAIHPEVGDSLALLAKVETARKRFDEAELAARGAMTIYFHSSTGETDRFPPYALDVLGEVAEARGQFAQAQALYQRALDLREQALGLRYFDPSITERDVAVSYRRLGSLLRKQGDAEAADVFDQQAEKFDLMVEPEPGLDPAGGGGGQAAFGDEPMEAPRGGAGGGPLGGPAARPPAPGVGDFGPR